MLDDAIIYNIKFPLQEGCIVLLLSRFLHFEKINNKYIRKVRKTQHQNPLFDHKGGDFFFKYWKSSLGLKGDWNSE
jgi:hypothetical protein